MTRPVRRGTPAASSTDSMRPRSAVSIPDAGTLPAAIARRVVELGLRQRLPDGEVAVTERPGSGPVTVEPDADPPNLHELAALVARLVPGEVIDQRAAHLRAVGALPDAGTPFVVVVGSSSEPPKAERCVALPLEVGPDALAQRHDRLTHRVDAPTLEDALAVLRESAGVVTGMDTITIAAAAMREPEGVPAETVAADAALDGIALAAIADAASRSGVAIGDFQTRRVEALTNQLDVLQRAHNTSRRRAVLARQSLAEQLQGALQEQHRLHAELEKTEGLLEAETDRREHVESEIAALHETITFRATSGLRSLYGRLRRS